MSTLEPGIHDPDQAPFWVFECEGFEPVTTQWMGEAVAKFAAVLAAPFNTTTRVHCAYMAADGGSGTYTVYLDGFPDRWRTLVVWRGDMV